MYPFDFKRTLLWFGGLISALGAYAIAGIVGNRADAGVLWVFTNLNAQYSVSLLLVAIISAFVTTPLVLTIWRYYRAHRFASLLNGLDDSLFRLLGLLNQSNQRSQGIKNLADEFLDDFADLFDSINQGCRISIYRPDRDQRDYLKIWRSIRMPTESVDRTAFYIGSRKNDARGVAGAVYKERKMRIVHFVRTGDRWSPDDPDYHHFKDTLDPAYHSFIAVPLLGPKENKPLGVLCIDAKSSTTFDSEVVQNLVISIGQRLASVLSIAENCGEPHVQKPTRSKPKPNRSRQGPNQANPSQ